MLARLRGGGWRQDDAAPEGWKRDLVVDVTSQLHQLPFQWQGAGVVGEIADYNSFRQNGGRAQCPCHSQLGSVALAEYL
jgi:hypothetical protein